MHRLAVRLRQGEAGGKASSKLGGTSEDRGKGVKGMRAFMIALEMGPSGAGQLHEEQGGAILPGGTNLRVESNLLQRGGSEDALL